MRIWLRVWMVLTVCAVTGVAAAQARVGVHVVGFRSAVDAAQVREGVEKRLARSHQVVPQEHVEAAFRSQRSGQERPSVDLQALRKSIAAQALVVVRGTGRAGVRLLIRVTVVSDAGMQGVKRELSTNELGSGVPEFVASAFQSTGVGGEAAAAAATTPDVARDCAPPCRSGYVCLDAVCVSACNPRCAEGERCDSNGECVAVVVDRAPAGSTASAPAHPVAAPTNSTTDDDWYRPAPDDDERTKRRSTGMMVGGIILTAGGGSFATMGLALLALGDTRTCDDYGSGERECIGYDYTGIGTGFLVVGGVAIAVGVPLILYGAARVPLYESKHEEESSGDTALLLGPRSAAIRVLW